MSRGDWYSTGKRPEYIEKLSELLAQKEQERKAFFGNVNSSNLPASASRKPPTPEERIRAILRLGLSEVDEVLPSLFREAARSGFSVDWVADELEARFSKELEKVDGEEEARRRRKLVDSVTNTQLPLSAIKLYGRCSTCSSEVSCDFSLPPSAQARQSKSKTKFRLSCVICSQPITVREKVNQ